MRYTINQLHKQLGKLIDEGHGRKPVCINKRSFVHNLEEDGCVILELNGLGVRWIPVIDDDGGTKWNQDGSESGRHCLILAGTGGANNKGELVSDGWVRPQFGDASGLLKNRDLENARQLFEIIGRLIADEPSSVEFHHLNPDFNEHPDCCIYVHKDQNALTFRGDSFAECLELAAEELLTEKTRTEEGSG